MVEAAAAAVTPAPTDAGVEGTTVTVGICCCSPIETAATVAAVAGAALLLLVVAQTGDGGLDASDWFIIEPPPPPVTGVQESCCTPVELGTTIADEIACGVGDDCFTNDCEFVA